MEDFLDGFSAGLLEAGKRRVETQPPVLDPQSSRGFGPRGKDDEPTLVKG